jgi:hypothetical protein
MVDLSGVFGLAYIDPGSGTVLLQILLSGLFAGVLFFRNTVLSLFSSRSRRGKSEDESEIAGEAPVNDGAEKSVPCEDRTHDRVHAVH